MWDCQAVLSFQAFSFSFLNSQKSCIVIENVPRPYSDPTYQPYSLKSFHFLKAFSQAGCSPSHEPLPLLLVKHTPRPHARSRMTRPGPTLTAMFPSPWLIPVLQPSSFQHSPPVISI